jgi:hypothetical protein
MQVIPVIVEHIKPFEQTRFPAERQCALVLVRLSPAPLSRTPIFGSRSSGVDERGIVVVTIVVCAAVDFGVRTIVYGRGVVVDVVPDERWSGFSCRVCGLGVGGRMVV